MITMSHFYCYWCLLLLMRTTFCYMKIQLLINNNCLAHDSLWVVITCSFMISYIQSHLMLYGLTIILNQILNTIFFQLYCLFKTSYRVLLCHFTEGRVYLGRDLSIGTSNSVFSIFGELIYIKKSISQTTVT